LTLLSAAEVFAAADKRGQVGVPCFDVAGGNADVVDAVCRGLQSANMSGFLASTPRSIDDYLGMNHFVGAVCEAQDRFGVVVAAHLDHAEHPEQVESALDAGIRSVMFDGSALPLSENIVESRRLLAAAHQVGATLEAEVGVIAGKEDPGTPLSGRNPSAADVAEFVEKVGPDLFAPAIGTIHGRRGGQAAVAWELAEEFAGIFDGPLVLHGTTGLPMTDVKRLLLLGYRKVNYATAVRDAFVRGIQVALADARELPRPQEVLAGARSRVGEFVLDTLAALRE
jgi:ketose-bisphosphate aldolase